MWLVSALCLTVTMTLCVVGIFGPKAWYDDNLLQRLGMTGIFGICWPRLSQLLELQQLTNNCMPASAQLAGHIGFALFAVGLAWKARQDYVAKRASGKPLTPLHQRL